VISTDPDDNKFCDCAIAAEANFVVAEDNHFNVLKAAGYKPKPIKPKEFIRQYLQA
jgi:predicted nucleic acid-binding protein